MLYLIPYCNPSAREGIIFILRGKKNIQLFKPGAQLSIKEICFVSLASYSSWRWYFVLSYSRMDIDLHFTSYVSNNKLNQSIGILIIFSLLASLFKPSCIFIYHRWNVRRGLVLREIEIKEILCKEDIDIFFLTETDTKTIICESDYKIQGFQTIFHERKNPNDVLRVICLIKEELVIILSGSYYSKTNVDIAGSYLPCSIFSLMVIFSRPVSIYSSIRSLFRPSSFLFFRPTGFRFPHQFASLTVM